MKAVGCYKPGGPDVLVDIEMHDPTPGPRELLVRVRAVSVNPVDYKVRTGYAGVWDDARVLGWDASGVVEAVGADASLFKPGDEVFYAGDLTRPGTNSELHAVDERLVGPKPRSLDFANAAALPLTTLTAWELLFDRLRVPCGLKTGGGTLLIINGAGGVGSILIQLARRLTGLTVVATASRPETVAWAKQMGAHHVIDHRQPLNEALKQVDIEQAEYVAGLTATGRHLPAIVELIAPQGRLALIDDPDVLDVVPFKRKSVTVSWELMFTRSMFQTPDMAEQHRILSEVSAMVDEGLIRSTLTRQGGPINAANLRALHEIAEGGSGIGKSVLVGF
jgi:zinc-binding alcohol dehydrogenase family protein